MDTRPPAQQRSTRPYDFGRTKISLLDKIVLLPPGKFRVKHSRKCTAKNIFVRTEEASIPFCTLHHWRLAYKNSDKTRICEIVSRSIYNLTRVRERETLTSIYDVILERIWKALRGSWVTLSSRLFTIQSMYTWKKKTRASKSRDWNVVRRKVWHRIFFLFLFLSLFSTTKKIISTLDKSLGWDISLGWGLKE